MGKTKVFINYNKSASAVTQLAMKSENVDLGLSHNNCMKKTIYFTNKLIYKQKYFFRLSL